MHHSPRVDVRDVQVSGRLVRMARPLDEWFRDVDDPAPLIALARRAGADVFTFWQRLPAGGPRHPFRLSWESVAVLPLTTFDDWYVRQINNKTRNLIVKARKKGLVVRHVPFDDALVEGVTRIFNETPIRQERRFAHYGKSAETVRREFSRFLFREEILGAYLGDELVGFAMIADAGRYAMLSQIISMVRHRDKSPTNLLIAEAVRHCAERRFPALVYALWPSGPLREFKRHNGFECVRLPRYHVPLTLWGRLVLGLQLHRNLADLLPEPAVLRLKSVRSQYYLLRHRRVV